MINEIFGLRCNGIPFRWRVLNSNKQGKKQKQKPVNLKWSTKKREKGEIYLVCYHLRRMLQPWFVNIICVDLHPKMEDIQRVKYIKWHRKPKYQQHVRMVLFSTLLVTNNRVYQQSRTMPVDHPSLQWPIQNRPISLQHLSICLPTINFPVLNHDERHHFDGNDSLIQESVEYNAMHRPLNKIHGQQYLQIVHHQWHWLIDLQVSLSSNQWKEIKRKRRKKKKKLVDSQMVHSIWIEARASLNGFDTMDQSVITKYYVIIVKLTDRIRDSGSFLLVCCHGAVQYLHAAIFCISVLLVPIFESLPVPCRYKQWKFERNVKYSSISEATDEFVLGNKKIHLIF